MIVVSPWLREMPAFTPERWERATKLKAIAGTFDMRFAHWIDPRDAQKRGVALIDTSRSMTPTVAEFAVAMTMNLLRDIPTAVQLVREGSWSPDGTWDQFGFVYGDFTGRKVGLAGFGSINKRYAELIAGFQCAVTTHDPFVSDDTWRPPASPAPRRWSTSPRAARSSSSASHLPPPPRASSASCDRRPPERRPVRPGHPHGRRRAGTPLAPRRSRRDPSRHRRLRPRTTPGRRPLPHQPLRHPHPAHGRQHLLLPPPLLHHRLH